ncbi:MAG: hypothetical protein LBM03_00750 [Erysipelotrichaceae bacterium]|jgi:UPF0042 nucleotide-binding protein|nr:hypothetical protein [Erysipelotrichaceae bacterium]
MIDFILLSGPSGSGKTTSQLVFEESGYLVIDNIFANSFEPIMLEIIANPRKYPKVLISVAPKVADEIISKHYGKRTDEVRTKFIVLDCQKDVLLSRFKLTRHIHLSTVIENISLEDAIEKDITYINRIKEKADVVIDTTELSVRDLRNTLFDVISFRAQNNVLVRFISFGHKYIVPLDCDLFLDTRALPNPFWVPELKELTGLDKPVIDYLNSFEECKILVDKMIKYLEFYLNKVQEDGRGDYCVGICCSGGHHRSVYVAQKLAEHFANKYVATVLHRDINKKEAV